MGTRAIGPEVKVEQRQQATACEHFGEAYSRRRILLNFYNLVEDWKRDNEFESSLTRMFLHPAYQRIIGFGKNVLPLIFNELREDPDYYFWALTAITGEDPVDPKDMGNLRKMTEAWLKWAEVNNY
jgi:hypothetical protein